MRIQALLEGEGSVPDGLLPKSLENERLVSKFSELPLGDPLGEQICKKVRIYSIFVYFFQPTPGRCMPLEVSDFLLRLEFRPFVGGAGLQRILASILLTEAV